MVLLSVVCALSPFVLCRDIRGMGNVLQDFSVLESAGSTVGYVADNIAIVFLALNYTQSRVTVSVTEMQERVNTL